MVRVLPGCREDFAPRLLPGLPEQTTLLLGMGKPPSQGSTAQLVWLHPRERTPTLLLLPQGRAENGAEQKQTEEKEKLGILAGPCQGPPTGSLTGTMRARCCAGGGITHRSSHPCLQSPPSQLCPAIRHLIMQQDAIAQFLQVSGPALTPAGTESRSSAAPAASFLSSIPRQKHFLHMQLPVLAGPGMAASPACAAHTSLGGPWRLCSPTCSAGRGSARLVSSKVPPEQHQPHSLMDGDNPAPSHPGHTGKGRQGRGGRRSSSEVSRRSPRL